MNYLFYLLVFLIPWLALSPWQKVLGVPGGYIFVALVMLFILALLIDNPRKFCWKNIKNTPLMVPLAFFIAANAASLLRILILEGPVGFWGNNFKEVSYLVFAVLFYWAAVNFLTDEQKIIDTVKVFLAGAVFACLIGILKLILYIYGSPLGVAQPWTVPRLLAPAGESQVLGGFIITLLPVVLAVLLYRISFFKVVPSIFNASVLLLALIMTFSAGAWAGFAVALFLLFIALGFYNLRQVLPVVLVFVLAGSVVVTVDKTIYPGYLKGFESITRKFTEKPAESVNNQNKEPAEKAEGQKTEEGPKTIEGQNTVEGQKTAEVQQSKNSSGLLNPAAFEENPEFDQSVLSGVERNWFRAALWSMFKSSPVLGVGPGNFEKLYVKHRPEGTPAPPFIPKPHNQYMEILAETGLLGSLAFMTVIISLFATVLTGWSALSLNNRKFMVGLVTSLAAVGVHGYAFGILVHIQIWLLAALISAVALLQNRGFTIRGWGGDRL